MKHNETLAELGGSPEGDKNDIRLLVISELSIVQMIRHSRNLGLAAKNVGGGSKQEVPQTLAEEFPLAALNYKRGWLRTFKSLHARRELMREEVKTKVSNFAAWVIADKGKAVGIASANVWQEESELPKPIADRLHNGEDMDKSNFVEISFWNRSGYPDIGRVVLGTALNNFRMINKGVLTHAFGITVPEDTQKEQAYTSVGYKMDGGVTDVPLGILNGKEIVQPRVTWLLPIEQPEAA